MSRWRQAGAVGLLGAQLEPEDNVRLTGLSQREGWKTSGVFALAHRRRYKKTNDVGDSLQV